MKSCKFCRYYKNESKYCRENKVNIIYTTSADKCTKYKDVRKLNGDKVKCYKCNNINKYSYCYVKRKCFSEEEQRKERKCINFQKKIRTLKNLEKKSNNFKK